MFAKIARPSPTAATIDAKLSSDSTMWAASFETSVPVMPIATPISAFSTPPHHSRRLPSWQRRPRALQRTDDPQFVFGVHPGVDGHIRSRARERVGWQLLQLCSRRHATVDADFELSRNDACRAWDGRP